MKPRSGGIFTSPGGRPLRHTNFRRRFWVPALAAAGLPAMHFHDLRHTGNMLAADAGANVRELMERMGHSTTRAATVYLHGGAERQHVIAAELSRQAGSGAVGPVLDEAIGHATGTAPPVGILTACQVSGETLPDLGFEVCAPTATRTRDLLLRRQSLYPLSYRGLPTA